MVESQTRPRNRARARGSHRGPLAQPLRRLHFRLHSLFFNPTFESSSRNLNFLASFSCDRQNGFLLKRCLLHARPFRRLHAEIRTRDPRLKTPTSSSMPVEDPTMDHNKKILRPVSGQSNNGSGSEQRPINKQGELKPIIRI